MTICAPDLDLSALPESTLAIAKKPMFVLSKTVAWHIDELCKTMAPL